MNSFGYATLFVLIAIALLAAMSQVNTAFNEADLERCFVWTCIASVIAGLPNVLW